MDKKNIRRIAEYLRNSDNAYDSESEAALQQLWDECEGAPAPSDYALQRLDNAVRVNRRRNTVRRIATWSAAAVLLALVYLSGYIMAPDQIVTTEVLPQRCMLVTAEGSVGKYQLPDGTQVWLNGASCLEYDSDFATNRKATLHGEGYFDVERDTLHPFTLSMEHLQVEVLGTAFDARCYGSGAVEDVVLRRGSVKVEATDGTTSAMLVPDERLVYDPGTGRSMTQSVNALNYCRWMEDRIMFSNVPLADIITNLERKYNVEIELAPNLRGSRRLSLTVEHDPIEDVLAVVNVLTGTRTRYMADGRIVLSPKTSARR